MGVGWGVVGIFEGVLHQAMASGKVDVDTMISNGRFGVTTDNSEIYHKK